jgi:Tol biopolymer transport system component
MNDLAISHVGPKLRTVIPRRRAAATAGSAVLLALAFAAPAFASFPGANGRIVFVSYRDLGSPKLFTLDPTVAAPSASTTQLTTAGDDLYPSVSPDGATVAFSRTVDATAGLYTVPLSTSNQEASVHLVVDDPGADEIEPSWSPDGHTLIYVSDVNGTRSLRTIDTAVPSATSSLLFSDTANDDQPVFDPADPTKIAFVKTSNGVSQIYLYDTVTHVSSNLSQGTSNDSKPDFAPNGGWLVFQSNRPVGGVSTSSQIWAMKIDGTHAHPLFTTATGKTDTAPVFSPDGTLVSFVRPVGGLSTDIETESAAVRYNAGGTGTGPTVDPTSSVVDLSSAPATDNQPTWAPIPLASTNLPEVGTPGLLAVAGLASAVAVARVRRRRSA